jgi:hypothetical protein
VPPSLGSKNKSSNQKEINNGKSSAGFLSAYSSILMMRAVRSSETSVNLYQTIRRHIADSTALYSPYRAHHPLFSASVVLLSSSCRFPANCIIVHKFLACFCGAFATYACSLRMGSLSPRHGPSSGYEWKRQPPYVERNYDYVEETEWYYGLEVVRRAKNSYIAKCYTGPLAWTYSLARSQHGE